MSGVTRYRGVRVCTDCGDRREFNSRRKNQSKRCRSCASKRRERKLPTRTCATCSRVHTFKVHYTPAQLARIPADCMSCTRKRQAAEARKDIDDVVVARLVDGIPVNASIGEKLTAASILRSRGATAAGTAMRLGVSVRTADRYFAELKAAA